MKKIKKINFPKLRKLAKQVKYYTDQENIYWRCTFHNTAGNTEMGCSPCFYSNPTNLRLLLKSKLIEVRNRAFITLIINQLMDIIGQSYEPKYLRK